MYLEWWMIALLIIALGLFAEWTSRLSYKQGRSDGYRAGYLEGANYMVRYVELNDLLDKDKMNALTEKLRSEGKIP